MAEDTAASGGDCWWGGDGEHGDPDPDHEQVVGHIRAAGEIVDGQPPSGGGGGGPELQSSVLEALVGRDFLPRGANICTFRSLVLQFVHSSCRTDVAQGEHEEWGEFLHLPGRRFYDIQEIRRGIQDININRTIKDAPGRMK